MDMATNADVEQAHEAKMPLVYGIGDQNLPTLLAKSDVAKFINRATEAAIGIKACLTIILANECAKDNAKSGGQLILDRPTEHGLIYAALAAAYLISDGGSDCLDLMDDRCRESEAGKHPSRF